MSHSKQAPPIPESLEENEYEDRPLWVDELERRIDENGVRMLPALREIARILQSVDSKVVRVHNESMATASDVSQTLALAKETVRHVQKMPCLLQTAEACVVAADASGRRAEDAVERLVMWRQARTEIDVTAKDIVEVELEAPRALPAHPMRLLPATHDDGFDLIQATTQAARGAHSFLRTVAMLSLIVATAAFATSGTPSEASCRDSPPGGYPDHDAGGRRIIECAGKPVVVLKEYADGTVDYKAYR